MSKFDTKYVTQKLVKERVIADHFAHCSPEEAKEVQESFPDKNIIVVESEPWKMYFDGVTNQNRSGIGVLLVSPKGSISPFLVNSIFPLLTISQNMKLALWDYKLPFVLDLKNWKYIQTQP